MLLYLLSLNNVEKHKVYLKTEQRCQRGGQILNTTFTWHFSTATSTPGAAALSPSAAVDLVPPSPAAGVAGNADAGAPLDAEDSDFFSAATTTFPAAAALAEATTSTGAGCAAEAGGRADGAAEIVVTGDDWVACAVPAAGVVSGVAGRR